MDAPHQAQRVTSAAGAQVFLETRDELAEGQAEHPADGPQFQQVEAPLVNLDLAHQRLRNAHAGRQGHLTFGRAVAGGGTRRSGASAQLSDLAFQILVFFLQPCQRHAHLLHLRVLVLDLSLRFQLPVRRLGLARRRP